ncbi:hypothetical protein [Crossiella sp. NPDC003009]
MIGVVKLHGTWSEEDVEDTSTECGTVAFRPDGTGWLLWETWSTGFDVHRFTYRFTGVHQVEIRFNRYLYGTWSRENNKTVYTAETDETSEAILTARFKIGEILEFDRRLSPGTIGGRFKRITDGEDPTTS